MEKITSGKMPMRRRIWIWGALFSWCWAGVGFVIGTRFFEGNLFSTAMLVLCGLSVGLFGTLAVEYFQLRMSSLTR